MTRYYIRATIDVNEDQEDTIRTEHDLPQDAPLVHTIRTEVWEAITAAGQESNYWGQVKIS
ncbi:hypothetical protein DFP74_2231 [Nocardiopsis sp. Huas11]|uniref:hypothetical protein n=1 Tax=Nocardiopsis sp. Huas11 TaxID=2183912 RepID=UPI000EB462D1|nr:hypothetical protein [Nocardiopsis sp. Huas11]RKS06592.1 hypothetical protein DFP74_2231 [Nocardiopsis sp. Huas11]